MRELFELFFTFAKMSLITFGGGYAILPIIEREIIEKRGWVTSDEVLQYYSIAQITPGVIAVNVSTFIGYKRKGVLGGIAATLGFAILPLTAIVIIALVLNNFSQEPIVRHCFAGIRLAVGALILDTVYKMTKKIFIKSEPSSQSTQCYPPRYILRNCINLVIFIASFCASVFFQANPILIVLCAGLSGFLFLGER